MKKGDFDKKTFGYIRVSSKVQQNESYSPDGQKRAIMEYAKKKCLGVPEIFSEAESASLVTKYNKRPQFQELIRNIEALIARKEPSLLIVHSMDRLGRNGKDFSKVKELVITGLFEVHFTYDKSVLDKDTTAMTWKLINQTSVDNEYYSDNLSEKVKFGIKEKVEQGYYPTKAPLGYKNVRDREGKGIIEPDQKNAPLIQKGFDLYRSGRYSLRRLANELHGLGFGYEKSVVKVSGSVMRGILSNPIYVGDFMYGGERYKGKHEPIISMALFNEVQRVMAIRGEKHVRSKKYTFRYGHGLITCGHCQKSVTAENKLNRHGHRYCYYHCSTTGCPGKHVVEEKVLDAAFEALVGRIHLPDTMVDWIVGAIRFVKREEETLSRKVLAEKRRDLERFKARLGPLFDYCLDRVIDREVYEDKKKEVEEKIGCLEILIEEIQVNLDTQDKELEGSVHIWRKGVELFKSGDINGKRLILGSLIESAQIHDKELTVTWKEPFGLFFGCSRGELVGVGNTSPHQEVIRLGKQERKRRFSRPKFGPPGVSIR